jgi:hypothetical protein
MKNRKIILLFAVILISLISIAITANYLSDSTNQDLRTRVTGTRLLNNNKSPYFYKFQIGDPVSILNTTERQAEIVNGNTVTPTVLLFTNLLHQLPLHNIRDIWYILSYLFFFGIIIFLVLKTFKKYTSTNYFLLFCASLFSLIAGWRLHCTAGQMYIIYAALGVATFYFYQKENFLLAAIFAGILTACRLPALLVFLPLFIFKKNTKLLVYFCLTVVGIFILTFFVYDINIWKEYFSAMQYYSLENAGLIPQVRPGCNITIPDYSEGVPNFITAKINSYAAWNNPDVFSIQKILVKLHLPSTPSILYSLFFVYSTTLFCIINKFNPKFYSNQKLLLVFASILMVSADYFLPALRFNYNFMQFLIVISVMMFFNLTMPKFAKCLLAIGILINIVKLNFIPDCYSLGEVLCLSAVVLTIIDNKIFLQDEVFEYNWIGNVLTRNLGLHTKMGLHRITR